MRTESHKDVLVLALALVMFPAGCVSVRATRQPDAVHPPAVADAVILVKGIT
ncbi:MAG: hypothetical protein ACE5E6_08280 [Phycisphaerae bacterium]